MPLLTTATSKSSVLHVFTQTFKSKSKSSHDLLDDSRLSSVPAVEQTEGSKKRVHSEDRLHGDVDVCRSRGCDFS